jgi:anti-anti-sigma factor
MRIQAVEAMNHKKVSLFLPSGKIEEKEFEAIEEKFKNMIDSGTFNIILDLSRVSHVEYKVVGYLIDYQKKFKEYGGDIKLVNVSPYIYDILRLYGFYPFEIYPSKRAALKSIA